MKLHALLSSVLAVPGLVVAHEHDEAAGYQEPFVGWTQADLDAKWGTDVSQRAIVNLNCDTERAVVGILRCVNVRPSATRTMSPASGVRVRHSYSWSPIRYSSHVQAWSTIWTSSHTSRFGKADSLSRFQSPSRDQSLPLMGQNGRLWRHPNHALRQRIGSATND